MTALPLSSTMEPALATNGANVRTAGPLVSSLAGEELPPNEHTAAVWALLRRKRPRADGGAGAAGGGAGDGAGAAAAAAAAAAADAAQDSFISLGGGGEGPAGRFGGGGAAAGGAGAGKEVGEPSASALARRPVWARPQRYRHVFHLGLAQEIEDFVRWVEPTAQEASARESVVDTLGRIVGGLWPQASVRTFGSFATNLYLPTSDVDLCVVGAPTRRSGDRLQKMAAALRKHGFRKVLAISGAKVPIVKCVDGEHGIAVDVSFDVLNGPENVPRIKKLMGLFPALRPLVLVLKCFLQQRGLNEVFRGGIGSYCLILLVTSHLQMHGCNFYRPASKPSLGRLLMDFFALYGKLFNYSTSGISVCAKGHYFNKAQKGKLQKERPLLLCVVDPQDGTNDVARSSFNIVTIRRAFAYGHSLLAGQDEAGDWKKNSAVTPLGCLIHVSEIFDARQNSVEQLQPAAKRARRRK